MLANSKYTFKNFLVVAIWILIGSGTVVLLIAAIARRNSERCAGIEISITGIQNKSFIDKKEVASQLEKTNAGKLEKNPLHAIDLAAMESDLKKNSWIKNAELYFDNNNVLKVKVTEREPVARIFTKSGLSFYIDSSMARIPLSDKFSARLPVFTDFPTDALVLSKEDSDLVGGIKTLSQFIENDPFWMAQIDQVNITSNKTFDLIPKLGDQIIHFGNADNCQEKFNNLLCFYKQVLAKYGWSRYSSIDVQFSGQVVATRRGANEIKMDSMRSVEIMKTLIANAEKQTNDSSSIQLDQPADNSDNINIPGEDEKIQNKNVPINTKDENYKPVSVTPVHVPEKPKSGNQNSKKGNNPVNHSSSFEKPHPAPLKTFESKPPEKIPQKKILRKPKAVMPSKTKTDY